MADRTALYHLPEFLAQVRETGVHDVRENLGDDVGGVLYHHRGVRVPGHNATFVWHDEGGTFELVIDGVDDRGAWVTFDADRAWDVFFARPPADAPYLAWMTDAEFEAEEADRFDEKSGAIGAGRFSFGLSLQPTAVWSDLEERAREADAPCFIYRPSGRTLIPEGDISNYERALPPELIGEEPRDYLGLVDADVGL
ncbi:hypothetical protein [Natronococcus wangiae]|uniref:hypothetical protein n=1 Tax=Natronococcus wangiae TaxID=3068275 RepID=UPI00273F0780|nr:hypothetical protein [Natronococcus sp. AD5]